MEVSKLTIQPGNFDFYSPIMNKKKRSAIRTQRVIDYIKEKPSGFEFSNTDLMTAAGYDPRRQYQSGWTFIKGLIDKKVICKHNDSPVNKFKAPYSVPGESKTVSVITNTPKSDEIPQKPDEVRELEKHVESTFTKEHIVYKAKQFAWERNSDSLRDFINTL